MVPGMRVSLVGRKAAEGVLEHAEDRVPQEVADDHADDDGHAGSYDPGAQLDEVVDQRHATLGPGRGHGLATWLGLRHLVQRE